MRKILPAWLFSEVRFEFVNRWRDWPKYKDYFVIWIGTEFMRGGAYQKFANEYSFDITLCNFGFKVRFCGNPPVSYAFLENRKRAIQPTTAPSREMNNAGNTGTAA